MPIQRFFLQWSEHCDPYRVCNWFRVVSRCNVKQLELRFKKYYLCRASFCWELLKTCDTLVELTLNEVFKLYVPEVGWLLPCLKKLNLIYIESGKRSLENLISGCSVLEELFLDRLLLSDYVQTVNVSSLSLKRLKIMLLSGPCEFVIDAPKLEYLNISDGMCTNYSLKDPMSLVEAHISMKFNSVVELLTCISPAKILTLTYESLKGLSRVHGLNLPMFPNLVKLVIPRGGYLLPVLLNKMPNLEHLTFSKELLHFGMTWSPPMEEAPACLRYKMKEVVIHSKVKSGEVALIRYLLKHSDILEKLTIHTLNFDPKRREKLLSIHRSSSSCRLEFV